MALNNRKPRSASSHGAVQPSAQPYEVRSRVAKSQPTTSKPKTVEREVNDFSNYQGWRRLLNPIWCYHGFCVIIAFLTIFGLVMVFSSSSISMVSAGLSPWKQAFTQGIYAIIGAVLFFFAMHIRIVNSARMRRIVAIFFVIGIVLQGCTFLPGIGIEVNGNRGWIGLAGFTFQPAEFLKLILCVALPMFLLQAKQQIDHHMPPLRAYALVVIAYVFALGLVIGGRDLGTCMIMLIIGFVAFWVCDFPRKALLIALAVGVIGILGFVLTSENRMRRIMATFQGCTTSDMQDTCYQSMHAKYAMASGGFFGVGMGNSREKWNYLPEAHNDFIYAIIGEETGFVGAAIVLILFLMLAWCLIVISIQMKNAMYAASLLCFTVWIVGQAFINMAVVLGILPVMGVPMPFISAGGSSLIMCLTAAGVCVSIMRQQPQIKAERARV